MASWIAVVDGRDVLLGDVPAADLVDELEPATGAEGLEVDLDLRVLALAAGLLGVGVDVLADLVADRLAVGDLRTSDVGADLELADEPRDHDVERELAHTGDQGLARLVVVTDAERRVLFGQLLEGGRQLVLVLRPSSARSRRR